NHMEKQPYLAVGRRAGAARLRSAAGRAAAPRDRACPTRGARGMTDENERDWIHGEITLSPPEATDDEIELMVDLSMAERRAAALEAELARWQRIARDRLRTLKAERKARGE